MECSESNQYKLLCFNIWIVSGYIKYCICSKHLPSLKDSFKNIKHIINDSFPYNPWFRLTDTHLQTKSSISAVKQPLLRMCYNQLLHSTSYKFIPTSFLNHACDRHTLIQIQPCWYISHIEIVVGHRFKDVRDGFIQLLRQSLRLGGLNLQPDTQTHAPKERDKE